MRLASVAFLLAAATLPASAQSFHEVVDGWTLTASSTRCYAINRDVEEYNTAPYNALTLLQGKDGATTLQVAYWPGALTAGGEVSIKLRPRNGKSQDVAGTAITDALAEATAPFDAEGLATLIARDYLDIKIGTLPLLSFRVADLPLARLAACTETLTAE